MESKQVGEEKQISNTRKGYMELMASCSHTTTHAGWCGGVMGHDVPDLDQLQVAGSQVCVCANGKRCVMNGIGE